MKKTHKSFFVMSMIDNIIPVSIALTCVFEVLSSSGYMPSLYHVCNLFKRTVRHVSSDKDIFSLLLMPTVRLTIMVLKNQMLT